MRRKHGGERGNLLSAYAEQEASGWAAKQQHVVRYAAEQVVSRWTATQQESVRHAARLLVGGWTAEQQGVLEVCYRACG